MKIPSENTPELAQWYLERGRDEKTFGIGVFVTLLVCFFPLAILWIPIGILKYVAGHRKIKVGEEMNRVAGRQNVLRPHCWPHADVTVPQFTSTVAPPRNARFEPAPIHPPTRLAS